VRLKLQLWVEGMREIPVRQLINYEITLLRRAARSIDGVYVCIPSGVVQFWAPDHGGAFRHFRDTFKTLPDFVSVRQVFVIDNHEDSNPNSRAVDQSTLDILQFVSRPRKEGGLGCELRIVNAADMRRYGFGLRSLLIVDDTEVLLVQGNDIVPHFEAQTLLHPSSVELYEEQYRELWDMATPIQAVIADVQSTTIS